ncbi:hypothetical protein SPBR_08927 [Sporothrix brasiliensis 5110]|uniref:Transcription factor domain-containing protein n=1 Tax=Sporothrix brasiliensis 5110 TaxID=1398154 RepID=A0A0C2ISK3_9PEZI|nr:uncharacterized protein SPBR_08927 [Sporothrix brasiliensis 5110]KIH87972.1 hypothetical protein SPBR_08927 [Sporothrix brasiliensis 5110]
MPGVPSSRGCDACRRQKKKELVHRPTLLPPLGSSAQVAVISRLVSALEVSDPRFDLSVYGSFIRDIPQRLGSNPALDAAAASLASTLPLVLRRTGTDDYDKALQPVNRATVPMLQEYGRALHSLRTALCDPVAIKAPNTLCALYLVVVTQGWLQGDGGNLPSHGEAVAMILRSIKRHRQSSWGDFENSVMSTLCFLVVMESFINPRINLDDNLWEMPEPHGPITSKDEPLNIDSLGNRYLAHVVKLLREPNVYQMELVVAYHRVRLDRTKLSALLATIPATPCPDDKAIPPISDALCRVHLRWQTAFGMLTLVAMRIGSVLSTLVPLPECMDAFAVLDLPGDLHAYRDDIVDVAGQALQYYPLGSSFMPLCLLAAYFSLSLTDGDANQRTHILRLFSAYRPGVNLDRELNDIAKALQPGRVVRNAHIASPSTVGCANEDSGYSLTASNLCTIL